MRRREFFKTVGGLAAVGAVAVAGDAGAAPAGWVIGWREYQHVLSQHVLIGYWWACHPDMPGFVWISPTFGPVRKYRELDVFDLYRERGQIAYPNREQQIAEKRKAKALLLAALAKVT